MSGVNVGPAPGPALSVERVLELTDLQIDAVLSVGPHALLYDVMEGDRGVVSNLIAHLPSDIQAVTIVEVTRRTQRVTMVQLRCLTDAGQFDITTTWDARGVGRPWVVALEVSAGGPRMVTVEVVPHSSARATLTWRRKRRGPRPAYRPAASTPGTHRATAASTHCPAKVGAAH